MCRWINDTGSSRAAKQKSQNGTIMRLRIELWLVRLRRILRQDREKVPTAKARPLCFCFRHFLASIVWSDLITCLRFCLSPIYFLKAPFSPPLSSPLQRECVDAEKVAATLLLCVETNTRLEAPAIDHLLPKDSHKKEKAPWWLPLVRFDQAFNGL